MSPVIVVHGGAWGVPDEWVQPTLEGVKHAAKIAYQILDDGGTALDAVEEAVKYLEDGEVFNAGRGSSLNLSGEAVMESSVQRGSDLKAGCVTLLRDVRHPVSLARAVMETTPHVFLAGDGARSVAVEQNLEIISPDFFVTEDAKKELQDFKNNQNKGEKTSCSRMDTVGAVALDKWGHVAAATSTGGTAGKMVGRIGDAPIIGGGTYADDRIGAVSCTGHGESILKYCLSHTIITLMATGMTSEEATKKAVQGMTERVQNTGGAISVSNTGDVGHHFTTKRMSWTYIKDGEIHFGIEPNQEEIENNVTLN